MKERGGTAKIIRLVEAKDDDDDKFWKAIGTIAFLLSLQRRWQTPNARGGDQRKRRG